MVQTKYEKQGEKSQPIVINLFLYNLAHEVHSANEPPTFPCSFVVVIVVRIGLFML